MNAELNNLKKHVFFELLNMAGRAFVLVGYSDDVILGNRGFTAEEKENGIILVFNSKMNFIWDDYGITATLVFGTSPQKCFVPADAITAVYSPELSTQFTVSPQPNVAGVQQSTPIESKHRSNFLTGSTVGALKTKPKKQESSGMKQATKKNVIEVDFTKKTKK